MISGIKINNHSFYGNTVKQFIWHALDIPNHATVVNGFLFVIDNSTEEYICAEVAEVYHDLKQQQQNSNACKQLITGTLNVFFFDDLLNS